MSQDVPAHVAAVNPPSAASEALSRLGFGADEQWRCRTLRGGQFLLPGEVAGQPARLILDTGMNQDVFLYRSFAEACGLHLEPEGEFERGADVTVACLGVTHAYRWVYVVRLDVPSSPAPPIAGAIGPCFLDGSVLAFDPATPAAGRLSGTPLPDGRPAALFRFALSDRLSDGQWSIEAVATNVAPRPARFMIDTGYAESVLSTAFVEKAARPRVVGRLADRARRPGWAYAALDFGSGQSVKHRLQLTDPGRPGAENRHLDECDGTLGMDFFRRWVTVLDLPARQVLIHAY